MCERGGVWLESLQITRLNGKLGGYERDEYYRTAGIFSVMWLGITAYNIRSRASEIELLKSADSARGFFLSRDNLAN